jgi:hypothetical protein
VRTGPIIKAMVSLIALIMEVVRTSEKSVNVYETTRRITPEGCDLQNWNSLHRAQYNSLLRAEDFTPNFDGPFLAYFP